MIRAAQQGGFIRRDEHTPFNVPGFRLNAVRVRFTAGKTKGKRFNTYFANQYGVIADLLGNRGHNLFTLEAREHTAQVESDLRELREVRFRFGLKIHFDKDRAKHNMCRGDIPLEIAPLG